MDALSTESMDDAKLRNNEEKGNDTVLKPNQRSQQQCSVDENLNVLSGVVCLVELANDDESAASVNATLLSLGATISPCLGEHLTHFITLKPSVEAVEKLNKRILVAELLNIFVVSSQWVEHCKLNYKKANEEDFRITGSLVASLVNNDTSMAQNQSTSSLQFVGQNTSGVDTGPAVNSDDQITASRISRASSHHSITNIEELERVIYDDTDTMLSTIHDTNGSTVIAATSALPAIPMPTFREYVPPVVPQRVLETVAKRRRSERISDLGSDTESETDHKDENDVSKRQRMESWECVQGINIDTMLPIVFLPGREGDKLPPFVLHKGANAYSTTNKGGSGIQGLTASGKKTTTTCTSGGGGTTSSSKAKSGAVSTGTKDSSAKGKDSKDIAVPRNKVVIAYTGFDDKQGERSTLLQTLRQLIKSIKRRAAEGHVVITPIVSNTALNSSEDYEGMDVDKPTGDAGTTLAHSHTSSTSINSLETSSMSDANKKKRGRPRSVSTTSRDSTNNNISDNNNNNGTITSTDDKNPVVDVATSSADKRLRGRLRQGSTGSMNNDTSITTSLNTNTNTNAKSTTSTTPLVPEDEITGWHIEAFECSVSLLTNQSDFSAASCTHVIVNANSNTRTLRRLFAMARGVCLVTQEWVHSSVSSQSWANVGLYLHPCCQAMLGRMREEFGTIVKDRIPRSDVFRGIKVCVVDSADPPLETLTDLVQAAGGVICYQIGERNVQYTVFGDVTAAREWVDVMTRKKKLWAKKAVADVKALAELGKCLTAKFVFNCIGEGTLRKSVEADGELITLDDLNNESNNDKGNRASSATLTKSAQKAPQTEAGSEVPESEDYYFSSTGTYNNTSSSTAKESTRRSRHSLSAEPAEAVPTASNTIDLTIDNPLPTPNSDKKKTTAERLQRQLSNEYLPSQSKASKNSKKGSSDSTSATTLTTAAPPKSAITSLLGTWIEVRFYGTGLRRSKPLTAALPALGADINYTPMYTNHGLISKSASMVKKNKKGSTSKGKNDTNPDTKSASPVNEKDDKEVATGVTDIASPIVSSAINDDNNSQKDGSSSNAVANMDNVQTTETVRASSINNNTIQNTTTTSNSTYTPFVSPFASPLARATTLCDEIPPLSHTDDTGTAQSSAAPTPLRQNNIHKKTAFETTTTLTPITTTVRTDNANEGEGESEYSIQAYPSNTQLVVDSLLELSRTPRNSSSVNKPTSGTRTDSKCNTTAASVDTSVPVVPATTKSTVSPCSNALAVAANSNKLTATTIKASKIRSASVSSDGRRESVFTFALPFHSLHMHTSATPPDSNNHTDDVASPTEDAIVERTAGGCKAASKANSTSDSDPSVAGQALVKPTTGVKVNSPVVSTVASSAEDTTPVVGGIEEAIISAVGISSPAKLLAPVPLRHPLHASLTPAVTSHSYSEARLANQSLSDTNKSAMKHDNSIKDSVDTDKSGEDNSNTRMSAIRKDTEGKDNGGKSSSSKDSSGKKVNDSPESKASSGSNERRVSYSMSVVAPDKVTDKVKSVSGADKKSDSGVNLNPTGSTSTNASASNSVPVSGNSGTPGRSTPYVPIKITTTSNSASASGTGSIGNRGLATSQRFGLMNRANDANSMTAGLKRKSQFVDPYQSYDSTNKLNKSSSGNILYAHTNTNSIYNASSTPQLSYGVYNSLHNTTSSAVIKPIAKNRNNSILEDDIQDDSSQEKGKSDQASLRGRVGGTAPFRSSYPPATTSKSRSNSISGHGRNTTASNNVHPTNSSTNSTVGYNAANRNSLPSSTSLRDFRDPYAYRDSSRPSSSAANYHNNNSFSASNSGVNTATFRSVGTPQSAQPQYRTNSNIYMRRSPLLSPSPNNNSTSSASHTPNSAYTANTSKKSNLHAPRLSSSNLIALTSHAAVGPAAKGLLIKKGKPVRDATVNSALNSTNLAIIGSRGNNPPNDAGSDAESEPLNFTPASQNAGVAAHKG